MKLTCLQKNLNEALTKVYRAVPTKSELPILSNVLISAKDNQLKLSATNLATTIVTYTGAAVEKEGSITLPAKLIKEFISNLTSGNIEIELDRDILHLTSDNTKTKFNGITSEDYPDLPEDVAHINFIELDAGVFNKTLASIGFSAATDESRPIFTGILLKFEGDIVTLAASDGFRLSETKVKLKKKVDKDISLIVPSKTLMEITRIFTADEPLLFGVDENDNLAVFKQNDTLVITRVLEGNYPDYQKIVPKEGKVKNIFAKEGDSAIVLEIDPEGAINLQAIAEEMGEHKGSIKAQVDSDEKVLIGFNSKYLMDFLGNVNSETITASTSGSTAACIFRLPDNENYFHIIMPIQLNK